MTWRQNTVAYMPALVIMVTVYVAAVSYKKRIDLPGLKTLNE